MEVGESKLLYFRRESKDGICREATMSRGQENLQKQIICDRFPPTPQSIKEMKNLEFIYRDARVDNNQTALIIIQTK